VRRPGGKLFHLLKRCFNAESFALYGILRGISANLNPRSDNTKPGALEKRRYTCSRPNTVEEVRAWESHCNHGFKVELMELLGVLNCHRLSCPPLVSSF
jgi:hypothetical protein